MVTDPAVANQPQQWQQTPKTRLIQNDHCIMTSELCAAYRPENLQLWPIIREPGYRKVGATWVLNAQNSPKKHLCKTSTVWQEKCRCFSVKNNYWWWHMGSSIWLTDGKKINGIASSVVATQEKKNLIFVGPCIIIQLMRTTNVMQHVAFVFIMPVVALYMFRVLFAPIIRSV